MTDIILLSGLSPVVRSADEWSKMMAFFYYKSVRPSCLSKTDGQNQEKIPSLS